MWKRFVPFAHAQSIFEIDVSFYKKLGVKFLLLDLDNTLDSYKTELPSKRVVELKEDLLMEGIEIIITSNNTGKRVTKYAKALGVRFMSKLAKPFSKRLLKKLKAMKIHLDEVILIGDQIVTDISCANGAKIKNVLTEKLVPEDQPTTRFNRLFDNPLRKKLNKKHLLKDWREF
ncbi:MAG: HAD hydrolase-like protein [Firmicutes bacterium]|nr:HAD hydrolase-like protein [Candidatus Fiminaster equi]